MSGFGLGHIAQLKEIQDARRSKGLPDHFLESRLNALIDEFRVDSGTRAEDVTWLQAKKYWDLRDRDDVPWRIGEDPYRNFAAYHGSIPQLSEAMRKKAGMLIPVLVDPRISLQFLAQSGGNSVLLQPEKYSAVPFFRRHRGEAGDPYWLLVQVIELQCDTSLSEWDENRDACALPRGINAHEGVCLHLQSPYHLAQNLYFPGDLANRSTRIAAMRRSPGGGGEFFAADARNLKRRDCIAIGVTNDKLDLFR